MENTGKYDISFIGEFKDKGLEREFFDYDMKRNAKFIGIVALIFGVIYMLFLISDYFAIEKPLSFVIICIIRILFLIVSGALYLVTRRIENYANLTYCITGYEIVAVAGFLTVLHFYESLTLLVFFSVAAIVLAAYAIPNKYIHAQIVSVFVSLSFFIFHAKRITGMESSIFVKLAAYNLIVIVFCNIGVFLTNFYKRKQYADSRELLWLSITDPLTGVYNRTKFNEEINRWVDFCNRYGNALSLVMFDIDDFKRVNDSYGHLMGDDVIQNIATTIKEAIRDTDIFARWGGEEFVVLLPGTNIHQAMRMMERMRRCIQNRKFGKVENITCSFGVAELKKDETAGSLLQRADRLLYNAKDCGKNVVVCEIENTAEKNMTAAYTPFVP